MFEMKPGLRYDMPVVFGPSTIPDVTVVGVAEVATIRFRTTREALAQLTPSIFAVGEDPVVAVAHAMYREIDYLGGRGYNVVRIAIPARFEGERDRVAGPYHPVIWESDTNPIVLGREWGGYAKIVGEIADLERADATARFSLREYGTTLLSGWIADLQPVVGPELAAAKAQALESVALGWKYSPGLEGAADADYATRLVANYRHEQVWKGSGSVTFERPEWQDAPISSHIVAALAALPIVDHLPSTITSGSMTLPRSAVRRLR